MSGFSRASETFTPAQLKLLGEILTIASAIERSGVRGEAAHRIAIIKELSSDLATASYIEEKVRMLFGR